MKPLKEHGSNGELVQVFVPNTRASVSTLTVEWGDVVRFSADGAYEIDTDGVRVPFSAGMTMGIPYGATQLDLFDNTGTVVTAQVVEVM